MKRLNLSQIKGWSIENDKLEKEFVFANFLDAIGFINKVAIESEKLNHHPNINLFDYKKVRIEIWTHEVAGLSQLDFKLAVEIDKL